MKTRRFHDRDALADFLTGKIGLTSDAQKDLLDQLDSKHSGSLNEVWLSDEQRSDLGLYSHHARILLGRNLQEPKYHTEKNPFHGYRIPVGKTDAHSPRPTIPDTVEIPCDDPHCGKTYSYTAPEIIRWY